MFEGDHVDMIARSYDIAPEKQPLNASDTSRVRATEIPAAILLWIDVSDSQHDMSAALAPTCTREEYSMMPNPPPLIFVERTPPSVGTLDPPATCRTVGESYEKTDDIVPDTDICTVTQSPSAE